MRYRLSPLFALPPMSTWGLAEWLIFIIVIASAIGIVYLVLQHLGIGVPPIVFKIFWIVVVAAVAIIAIRFLLSL